MTTDHSRVDVVLPAGGRISGEFARAAGTEVKTLIRLGANTLLEHTLGVLRELPTIGRCIVVGPPEVLEVAVRAGADDVVAEGSDGPDNLYRGLGRLQSAGTDASVRALVLTTDLPFLTAAAVDRLLVSAPCDEDISVPLVRREAFEARFPLGSHEYVRLADGEWTMGCGFIVRPAALIRARPHVERVFAARKSPLRMALLLGVPFVASWLTHRLTVDRIVQRCSSLIGCRGAALLDAAPELAFDIDKPEEFREAQRYLQGHGPGEGVAT